ARGWELAETDKCSAAAGLRDDGSGCAVGHQLQRAVLSRGYSLAAVVLPLQRLQAARDLLGVRPAVEGGDAEETFALRAETAPRSDDHVRFAQNPVERLPACDTIRRLHPEIRRVDAPEGTQARGLRAFAQHFGVAQIMLDQRLDLRLAFGCVKRFGGALDDVA